MHPHPLAHAHVHTSAAAAQELLAELLETKRAAEVRERLTKVR